ncbi:hypothetical protein FHR32_001898 [Streptosporangium album]|uniref:Uncharacterized protein n=1 Tax=Streptosporangium album TaxID=47479 RepID=A0A7W7RSW0_9ACTN|nr:hypothetical protein [Streptosporangium album]MBB4937593.1 hypothetical protein [Streptosporangium album]
MTVIGIVLLAIGLVVGVSLTLADPVLLSLLTRDSAEGTGGRRLQSPPADAAPV